MPSPTRGWQDGSTLDMLVEMRKVALLILMGTLFAVDFAPELERLWQPILQLIEYISPGLWIVWPGAPGKASHKQAIADHGRLPLLDHPPAPGRGRDRRRLGDDLDLRAGGPPWNMVWG